MRTYDTFDANGTLIGQQVLDDTMAPSLLAGHTAKLVELDGAALTAESQVVLGATGTGGDDAPKMLPELVTEAAASAALEEPAVVQVDAPATVQVNAPGPTPA